MIYLDLHWESLFNKPNLYNSPNNSSNNSGVSNNNNSNNSGVYNNSKGNIGAEKMTQLSWNVYQISWTLQSGSGSNFCVYLA